MNVKAKRIFAAVLLVVMLLAAAGAASARGWGGRGRGMGGGYGPCGGGYRGGDWCGAYYDGPRGGGRGGYYDNDRYGYAQMPQELRDKMAEARKIEIDLRNELSRNPVNREMALELHKKHGDIMREIYDWQFQQRFDTEFPR